ncbi:MAG: hypothetical protein V4625_01660 [Pseudomonadota bacterium]
MPPPEHPGIPGGGHEEGPGKSQNEEPEVRYEDDIPSDGADGQGEAEIRHVPSKPELSPVPDRLKN